MNRTIYSHPDGFTLAFNDNVLTATDDDGKAVCLPIGSIGLAELGNALLALATEQEEEFTSEHAGAATRWFFFATADSQNQSKEHGTDIAIRNKCARYKTAMNRCYCFHSDSLRRWPCCPTFTQGPADESASRYRMTSPPRAGFLSSGAAGYTVQNPVLLATWWLHETQNKKARYVLNSRLSISGVVGRE